jgi:symplekin
VPQGVAFRQKIDPAINAIDDRIRALARIEEQRRLAALERKRPYPASPDEVVPSGDAKRMKLDHDQPPTFRPVGPEILANFDFSSLPTAAVTDIIVGSLKILPEATLKTAIEVIGINNCIFLITNEYSFIWQTYQKNAGSNMVQRAPPTEPAADRRKDSAAPPVEEVVVVIKEEPIDPLNMDLEEEAQIDLDATTSRLDQDVRLAVFPHPNSLANILLGLTN